MIYLLQVELSKHLCTLVHLELAGDDRVFELDQMVVLEVRKQFADLAVAYEKSRVVDVKRVRQSDVLDLRKAILGFA